MGIDTLAITGPTGLSTLYELVNIQHKRSCDRTTGEVVDYGFSGFHSLEVGGATVGVSAWVDGAGPHMRIQASVPRMLHGHNWDGVSPTDVPEAIDMLLAEVADELPDVPRSHQVRITRLDLTRDFLEVRDPSATLGAIARHQMVRSSVNEHYLRRDGRGIQTLVRGNKTHWMARGYDKGHEALRSGRRSLQRLSALRPQQLRFELELRSKELRRRGLTSVEDLVRVDLTELAHHYFDRCRFDVNTAQTGIADLIDQLTADGIPTAEQRNLVLYLTCLEHDVTMLGRAAFERSRALANKYKLGAQTLGRSTFTRRLDFELAREVVE